MPKKISISLLAGAALAFASPAFAAWNPQWLACDGQALTTGAVDGKPVNETKPIHVTYAVDDATQNFYRYSETRKNADPQSVTAYSADEIRFGVKRPMGHSSGAEWDGRLDRKTLALTIDYNEGGARTVFTQQCSPTKAPADMPMTADAGNQKSADARTKNAGLGPSDFGS